MWSVLFRSSILFSLFITVHTLLLPDALARFNDKVLGQPVPRNPPSVAPQTRSPSSKRRINVRHHSLNLTQSTIYQSCDPFTNAPIVNSTFPGPTIRARAGEILQVRVYNHLPSNLTMHFHGLSMKMHPVMDGTTMVSQWPISPGNYFDYRIPLTAEDKGTYFYHSHVGVQAMTAYGAVIVEDPQDSSEFVDPSDATQVVDKFGQDAIDFVNVYGHDGLEENGKSSQYSPYKYDEDRVLAVSDWWSYSSPDQIERQLGGDPFIWPGSANKLLLNGHSSPNPYTPTEPTCNQTKASDLNLSCNDAPNNCETNRIYPEIHLDYEKTYRLRLVGATSLMYVSLAILKPTKTPFTTNLTSEHMENLTLIEADGSYLDALDVSHVEFTTGQRYSVLYTSRSKDQVDKDGTGGVYWMRVESRWRSGPSMWVKLVYSSSSSSSSSSSKTVTSAVIPPIDTGSGKTDIQLLPKEKFGWVTSWLSPLSKANGPDWWYSETMPDDDQVTRTVIIDTQQVRFYASGKGLKWDENGQLFNDTFPTTANNTPYLIRTFLGEISFPSQTQFETAMYNPTSYETSSGLESIVNMTNRDEMEAAKRRNWGQGYDKKLNMYFAEQNEVIDIILVNRPSETGNNVEIHPWHMHSHKHYTRLIQPGTFNFTTLESLYSTYSSTSSSSSSSSTTSLSKTTSTSKVEFGNPIQRDTTVVYASPGASFLNQTITNVKHDDGGWAVLRYKVNKWNAGIFLLHCHIQFHLYMGMATVFTIDPNSLADQTGIYWPKQNPNQKLPHSIVKNPASTKVKSNIQGLDWNLLNYNKNVSALV